MGNVAWGNKSKLLLLVVTLCAGMAGFIFHPYGYSILRMEGGVYDFVAKWIVDWRMGMRRDLGNSKTGDFESDVIRVELGGRWYDVPLRFTYGQAVEKYGRWPVVKPGRTNVRALTLSMLLPELKPYYLEDDVVWKARNVDRVEITITDSIGVPDWWSRLRDNYLSRENKFATRGPDVYGLIHFEVKGMDDLLIPLGDGLELSISCSSEAESESFSPSCGVKSNYRPGIALEYYFPRRYLSSWREIDLGLKNVFDSFETGRSNNL